MSSASTPPLARTPRVLVIGAGVGGMCAAARLAHAGLDVRVLERADAPGGKMRQVPVGHTTLDGGPTVLTMRWVFDELFALCGESLDAQLRLRRCEILARHRWGPDAALDLHADARASAESIAALCGAAEARRFAEFCERARRIYATLEAPFMRSSRPSAASLTWRVSRNQGPAGLRELMRISPFTTMWQELGRYFHDPRLRQLFGRYATYCGSSPFSAPATLMLVAHVEQDAVWQIDGGMHGLAQALTVCARRQGARVDFGHDARRIVIEQGHARGVELASGERLEADFVVFNGDAQALTAGLLGDALRHGVGPAPDAPPSLSALTWHVEAKADGFDLSHHNVFFGPAEAYADEFAAIDAGRLPESPTVYVCAQDRQARAHEPPRDGARPERLMALVNAPALPVDPTRDRTLLPEEIERCEAQMWNQLERSGLRLTLAGPATRTTPQDFARLFPGSRGALYGPASQGWRASFEARPAGRTRVPGLVLAGGSVHPGPGVPMAGLSGQLAAQEILADLASTSRSRPAATPGGTSTPSATRRPTAASTR
jgi:1-hydroxycarotenoid 3,4-desaturase